MMYFFTPLAFCFSLTFSSSSVRKEYNFGFSATNSVITAPPHSSFINPIFFLFSGTIGMPFNTAGFSGEKSFVSNHFGTSAEISAKKSSVSISSTNESVSVYRTETPVHFCLYITIVEIKHQKFGKIQDCHPCEDGFIHDHPRFLHLDCNQKFIENLHIHKVRFCFTSFSAFSASFTSSIETRFLKFSMVFPNTELFINLKNSFSNFVFPFALNSVFLSI